MISIFADTGYWIALISPRDELHQAANSLSVSVPRNRLVTSELVLAELLDNFAGRGRHLREMAAASVVQIRRDKAIEVVPLSVVSFDQTLQMYLDRRDKQWSFTDCSSFGSCNVLG